MAIASEHLHRINNACFSRSTCLLQVVAFAMEPKHNAHSTLYNIEHWTLSTDNRTFQVCQQKRAFSFGCLFVFQFFFFFIFENSILVAMQLLIHWNIECKQLSIQLEFFKHLTENTFMCNFWLSWKLCALLIFGQNWGKFEHFQNEILVEYF